MEGKCWNCGKMNEEKPDGYFWCNCKDVEGGGRGLWYLPLEVVELRKELSKAKNERVNKFLDDEEKVNE